MATFGIRDLDKALDHKNITVSKQTHKKEAYIDRIRIIEICGEAYKIEWWANTCYLYYGDLTIPFRYVNQSNTWPHNSKTNLQFYDAHDNICCILKIENW